MPAIAQKESRIQVLKQGVWPCNAGLIRIDDTVISDVLKTYNPAHYAAPLTVTHQLAGGHTERTLPLAADLSEGGGAMLDPRGLAYGTPSRLELRPDGGVDAVFDRISPCFATWVRNGNLLSVSPGLYRPTDTGNPTPGFWALKHIAGLGSEPPAQKGMDRLTLAEFDAQKIPGSAIALSGYGVGSSVSVYHSAAGFVPSVGAALAEARRQSLWC